MSVLAAVAGSLLASCAPAPAVAPGTTQAVLVDAPSSTSTSARVTFVQRDPAGCWRASAGPWRARVGRNGLSARHREGDGTTPLGTFGLGRTIYGTASNPGLRGRYHRLVCGDWWNEDPGSPTYNSFRHVSCGDRPLFGGKSEHLWTETHAYRLFAVIDYNTHPAVPGRGSAIFLHAATGRATNGCVSLPIARLTRLLRALRPAAHPQIAIRVRRSG